MEPTPKSSSCNSADLQPGEEIEVDFTFECWLTPHTYTVTIATQDKDGSSHDWLDDAITFDVVSERQAAGVTNLRAEIECRKISPHVAAH